MNAELLNLPNEILEIIIFKVIGKPWKDDVRDFLSFTATCQRLYNLSHDEKYWQILALRRNPTNEKPNETMTWLDYCKQIYLVRTIQSKDLISNTSRFNENYFCHIEKILLWPDQIRIYIDERGNNSLGAIQDPMQTKIAFVESNDCHSYPENRITPHDCKFSIEDKSSQYLGYLNFLIDISSSCYNKILTFQYGSSGYAMVKLFELDQNFIDKHNLSPLMKKRKRSNIKSNNYTMSE